MREIASGLWQLGGWPSSPVNVCLAGAVLVDAGARQDAGRFVEGPAA